jgi:hypothetical protein
MGKRIHPKIREPMKPMRKKTTPDPTLDRSNHGMRAPREDSHPSFEGFPGEFAGFSIL